MIDTQTLTIDTIVGPKPIDAPAGWEFDKTATTAWSWLLTYTRRRSEKLKTQRDGYVIDGQIQALAIVLANSLGMAPFYWEKIAREMA